MKKVFSFLTIVCFVATLSMFSSCSKNQDDLIVGTWQRGWGEGDVVIDGDTELEPDNFTYDLFVFRDDGSYNGMMRKGTFTAYDTEGEVIYEGDYQCDNNNLKLTYLDEDNVKRSLLAQVVSFDENAILIRYDYEQKGITVTFIIRKKG